MIATFRTLMVAPLLATLLLFPACSREKSPDPAPDPASPPPPPPGAVNDGDGDGGGEVAYQDLEYDQGTFTRNGEKFTGTAVQHYGDADKTLKSRYQFVDGLFDGEIQEFYENGQRSALKMYRKGMRHGITVYWDEEGTLFKKVLYEDDEEKQTVEGEDLNPAETP